MAGLEETGARGTEPKYGAEHRHRLLAMLDWPPRAPLLAGGLGDIHEQYIWRFLRAHKIDLSGRRSWCESDDPEFVEGGGHRWPLYDASRQRWVLSVDEKPSKAANKAVAPFHL